MEVNVNEYRFQGHMGEQVPKNVTKLIVAPGIQVLPDELCRNCGSLQQATLPEGLSRMGCLAFLSCKNLSEIRICSTMESIGDHSFAECHLLKTIEFASSASSTHQLKTIGNSAFSSCLVLSRIKIPPSVEAIGKHLFLKCRVLVEAILSSTSITEVPRSAFLYCSSLQSVSLPNSLEHICAHAFCGCECLITLTIPLNSQPIELAAVSFGWCGCLANLVLPQGSNADPEEELVGPFHNCDLLHQRFGEETDDIIKGLVNRFDGFPVHEMCYSHSSITREELVQCIENQGKAPLVDRFGMTPFHVLFSTAEPSGELLNVLLQLFPHYVLDWKDANGNRPLDYLVNNWTETTKSLVETTLQLWMIDPLVRWGATSWTTAMQKTVQSILAEDDKEQRSALCNEATSAFAKYQDMEATSILEMALWKGQLNRGRNNDGSKGQALDREESRSFCGSTIVIPNVLDCFEDCGLCTSCQDCI